MSAYPLISPYYPYYYYPPELDHDTHLPTTFPEHHWPLEHTRHAITHGLHGLIKDSIPQPCADVRETLKNYYIDVELSGVASKSQIKLKWLNLRTLYLEVLKEERKITETEDIDSALLSHPSDGTTVIMETDGSAANDAKTEAEKTEAEKTGTEKKAAAELAIHKLVKERHIGFVKRAFSFPVDVDVNGMVAKLHHGVLELTLAKVNPAAKHHETVVEHE
jgi:HSP20 family molecular chaperone IbpA